MARKCTQLDPVVLVRSYNSFHKSMVSVRVWLWGWCGDEVGGVVGLTKCCFHVTGMTKSTKLSGRLKNKIKNLIIVGIYQV